MQTTLFAGLIVVTSTDGVGKTSFCTFNGVPLDQIAFVDDDPKNAQLIDELRERNKKFGLYIPLIQEARGLKEVAFHEKGLQAIERVKAAGLPVLIWDTWARFENTFHPYVDKYPGKFRDEYSKMGEIKGAEKWIVSFDYETQIIDDLLRAVRTVFVTTHARPDRKIRTLLVSEGKRPLAQRAVMRVWLTQADDGSPLPTALLLKRPLQIGEDEEGFPIPVNVFPRKVKHVTWKVLRDYWKNPIGNRPLTKDETPNDWELSILDNILTAEQKLSMKIAILEDEQNRAQEEAERKVGLTMSSKKELKDPATFARELKVQGKKFHEIVKAMKEAGYTASADDIDTYLEEVNS